MTAQTFSAPAEERPSSMVFRPAPDRSRWEGLAIASWVLIVDGALLLWLLRRPVNGVSFLLLSAVLLSLPLLLHLLYRTWGAFTLEYWLDRNAVRIRWAGECVVVPLPAIRQIISDGAPPVQRSLRFWPASFVRPLANTNGEQWALYASRPPGDSLWLETDDGFFAISPAQPDLFLAALQEHNRLGPSHRLKLGREQVSLRVLSGLEDRLGRWLLLAGLAGVLVLFGLLFVAYPALPDLLIFHYDANGLPDSIRPKNALFLLPSIGLAAFGVNSLAGLWMAYRRQPTGAYLLWGSTLAVQFLSLLALFSLIR
ncbi:MAG: PH domain-containing protein [Caldilineaceae bacterium]|nr:PH domain-containing protein [Caldilineaceae bacterium]HRJ41089.1 DUF1648 domain-containing protein [Caldilineaceae bacterium]